MDDMAQQCSLCDSWWPETCVCAQLALDAILGYQNSEASAEAAQQARRILVRGVSLDSRACHYHKTMLQDLVKREKTKEKPSGPVAMAVFDDCVLWKTAFLPMCMACGIGCGVLSDTAEGPTIIKEVDSCTCALAILDTSCAFCEIQRISAATELAVQRRGNVAVDGLSLIHI